MRSEVKRGAPPPSSFLRRMGGWAQPAPGMAAGSSQQPVRVFPLPPARVSSSTVHLSATVAVEAPAPPAPAPSPMQQLVRSSSKLVKRRPSRSSRPESAQPAGQPPRSPPPSSASSGRPGKSPNLAIARSGSVSGISTEGYRSSELLPLATTLSRSATLPPRAPPSNASTSPPEATAAAAPAGSTSASASSSSPTSSLSAAPQTPLDLTPLDTPVSLPPLLRNSSSSSSASARGTDEVETPHISTAIPRALTSASTTSFITGDDSALVGWTVVDTTVNKTATSFVPDGSENADLAAYERPRPRFAERPSTPTSVEAPSESSTSTVKARLNLRLATSSSVADFAPTARPVERESSDRALGSPLFGVSMRGRQSAKPVGSAMNTVAEDGDGDATVRAERPKFERSSSVKRLLRSLSKKRGSKDKERADRVFPVPPSAPPVPPVPQLASPSPSMAGPLSPTYQPNLPTISSSPDPSADRFAASMAGTVSGAVTVPCSPRTVSMDFGGTESTLTTSPTSFIPRRSLSLRRSHTSPNARLVAQRQSFSLSIERPVALAATRRSTLYDIEDDNAFALALKEIETASPEYTPEDFARANHTVRDFIVTERAYAGKLERGVQIIESPLSRRKSQHDTPDIALLHERLPRLFRLSMALVTLFEKHPTIEGLATAFVSLEDELLSEYGAWCEDVGEVIVAGTAQALSLDLSDIIITPVQRATRYELLFATILRGLPVDAFLHVQVSEALAAAHRLALECDRRQTVALDDLRRDSVDRYRRTRSRPLSLAGKPRLPVW